MKSPADYLPRISANSMFVRVFAVFGGLMLTMTLVYGVLIVPLQQDSLLKVLYSQADTVSRSIIQACSDALLTGDYGYVVEHNLQVLRNNQSIQQVVITPKGSGAMRISPTGWSMNDEPTVPKPGEQLELEFADLVTGTDGGTYYRFITPIRFTGVGWGSLQIDFDTRDYRANMVAMYRQLVFSSMFAMLIVLPIGYLFSLWLTRPIADISRAAARVARGDLDAYVNSQRSDEIGHLSASFNLMVGALQHSRVTLQNYNQELERKVAERTQAIDELNHTLDRRVRDEIAKRKEQEHILIHQSRLAAMGEMIGNIAHQWRQPLNALSLVIQNIGMQHRAGQLTPDSMQRMGAKAEQLIGRMSSTIDEFRNFFKPNKLAEPFNLSHSLRASADIMEGVFKNHNIDLSVQCDESIELMGVAGEFSQVVLNLLSNAKDAVLEAGPMQPQIVVHAAREGDRVRIDVDDNGRGIGLAILDRVFEPYFTTKEEGKGSGIGLYMSKMIVENYMLGGLSVSNTGNGARFTIDVPAIRKDPHNLNP